MNYGARRGFVLEPLLFPLHVNDEPNVSKFEVTLFANDFNLLEYSSHDNIKTLQTQTDTYSKSSIFVLCFFS